MFIHSSLNKFIHVAQIVFVLSIFVFFIVGSHSLIACSFPGECFLLQDYLRPFQISLIYILQAKSSCAFEVVVVDAAVFVFLTDACLLERVLVVTGFFAPVGAAFFFAAGLAFADVFLGAGCFDALGAD